MPDGEAEGFELDTRVLCALFLFLFIFLCLMEEPRASLYFFYFWVYFFLILYMPDGGAEGFELVCERCDARVLCFDRLFVLSYRLHKGSIKAQ